MTMQAMQDFLAKVAATESLHAEALNAWSRGGMPAVLSLGQRHGYEFSPEEVIAVRDAASQQGTSGNTDFDRKLQLAMGGAQEKEELTDGQLDLVAGGGYVGPVTETPPK